MFEWDPNKIDRNHGPSRERSNKHSSVRGKYLIGAKEVEELSGYIIIYPMPPTFQNVLKKVGLELS